MKGKDVYEMKEEERERRKECTDIRLRDLPLSSGEGVCDTEAHQRQLSGEGDSRESIRKEMKRERERERERDGWEDTSFLSVIVHQCKLFREHRRGIRISQRKDRIININEKIYVLLVAWRQRPCKCCRCG